MQKVIQKFFSSDKVLWALPFIYTVCSIIAFIVGIQSADISIFSFAICLGLLFTTVIAYKKHEKNVMKAAVGALLMAYVEGQICLFDDCYGFAGMGIDTIFCLIFLIITVIFFVSHFILAYGHKARPGVVKTNQFLVVASVLLNIIWNVVAPSANYPVISAILDVFCSTLFIIMITCIETRVDAYKLAREANGYKAE